MATEIHGKATKLYVGGYDLTQYFQHVTSDGMGEALDTTVFGLNSKRYAPGLLDAKVSLDGLFAYDPTHTAGSEETDEIFAAALNSATGIIHLPNGDGQGAIARAYSCIESAYSIDSPATGIITCKGEAQSTVGMEPSIILHQLQAETANGNGASFDSGATWQGVAMPSTNGLAAYLQVMAEAGTAAPSLTVKVQHSSDNVTFVDLATFTAVTAAHKQQRVFVAGTVNRYLRALWTITGTTPSFTFVVAACRK